MRVNEQQARKPTWKPGAEVVLADGQAWQFPRPRLVYRMAIDPATKAPIVQRDAKAQGQTYAEWLDRLEAAETDSDVLVIVTAMALDLLRQNYEIPDEAVPGMFAFEPGNKLSVERWGRLRAAVRGVAEYPSDPKA